MTTTIDSTRIDLTEFDFTPTESLAYSELLARGPTSGYVLAKELRVARANAYQALAGLCAKRAATEIQAHPRTYRAAEPAALLAELTARQSEKLDRLEGQLTARRRPGSPATVGFKGERAFQDLALRTAARSTNVTCLAPASVLQSLNPVWRKRVADGAPNALWVLGESTGALAAEPAGAVPVATIEALFGVPRAALLVTEEAGILGRSEPAGRLEGYWTSDPTLLAAVRGAVNWLTSG